MGVRLQPLPEHGVTLQVLEGTVTPDELFKNLLAMRERAAGGWRPPSRWISYVAPTADLSPLNLDSIPNLRRAAAIAIKDVFADEPFTNVFVCAPSSNWQVIDTWRRFIEVRGEHPTVPVLLPNLQAACDRLNLPDLAHRALAEAIGAERFEERETKVTPGDARIGRHSDTT
jgi:hypothetical protein